MESITSHIKKTSRLVRQPTELKSRVMAAVTQTKTSRSTGEGNTIVQPSPYFTPTRTRFVAFAGTLCLIVVIGLSSFQTTTPVNPAISTADTIINEIAAGTTYDESWYDAGNVIDDMNTYSQLMYSEQEQVSSQINNLLV